MMSTGHNPPPRSVRGREAAFSIIETLCGMTLILVGLLTLASSTVTGMATNETNRESACATSAAQQFLESVQVGTIPFEDLFLAYMTDPADAVDPADVDPALLANAPKGVFRGKSGNLHPILARGFEVAGLEPRKGTPRESMGAVAFPVVAVDGAFELREDIAGRDLNGDGVIDGEDHATDYKILPVTVKVEWDGARGEREFEIQTILIRR